MFLDFSDTTSSFFILLIIVLLVIIAIILLSKIRLLISFAAFAYPNAKFNAMGNYYVNYPELQQLTALGSMRSALNQVSNKYYPLKNVEKIDDVERKLIASEIRFFKNVYTTVPTHLKSFIKCYMLKWESKFLKSILAEKLLKSEKQMEIFEEYPDLEISKEKWMKLRNSSSINDTLGILSGTRYYSKLKEILDKDKFNISEIEHILDGVFFNELNKIKSNLPRHIAKPTYDFINITNDISNIKLLLRSKHLKLDADITQKMLNPTGKELSSWKISELNRTVSVPELISTLEGTKYHEMLEKKIKEYNQTGDIQMLDLALDNYYLKDIINLSLESSLTVGPTLRFIISKEYETRNLITVLRGLNQHISSEKILSLTVSEQKSDN